MTKRIDEFQETLAVLVLLLDDEKKNNQRCNKQTKDLDSWFIEKKIEYEFAT